MLLWFIAGLGVLLAAVSLALVRRLARQLDALTQSYWELRYDYTRLRSTVERIDPGEPEAQQAAPTASASTVSFVPLASIRSKAR